MVSIVVAAVAAVSVGAVSDWADGPPLGDVAVSFDNQILLLDNADPDDNSPVDTIPLPNTTNPVAGSNGGLQFDAFLNLLVTNFDSVGTGRVVALSSLSPHYPLTTPTTTYPYGSTIGAPPNVSAIAIAGNGTIYAASRSLTAGGRATIWRINPNGSFAAAFTVLAETTNCVGIDLDPGQGAPGQSKLYLVTGGRSVSIVSGVDTITGSAAMPFQASASLFTTLPGNGNNDKACGIRLLAPPDIRESTPPPPLDLVRLVVADGKNVKYVRARPAPQTPSVVEFDAGSGSKDWFDVAVDPVVPTGAHVADVWGVDRGGRNLAKFRLGTGGTVVVEPLSLEPRGVAVNGELRFAQTLGQLTVNTTTRQSVTFYPQNTAGRFTWAGLGLGAAGATLAIQAFEVTFDAASGGSPDVNTGLCAPSHNTRCRLLTNFSESTPKINLRGRSAVLREILRSPPTNDNFRISVEYRDLTGTAGGPVCMPGVVPPTTAMARDAWDPPPPGGGAGHKVFDDDAALAFYGGDDGTGTIRKTNDTIILSRTSPAVKYNLRIVNPSPGTTIQVKRSLPISVEVKDPFANCAAVPGLTGAMIFTVTDVTTAPGTPVGDTIGFIGAPLTSSGHPFAFSANLYRTNLNIDPARFPVNRTFRLCPQIPSNQLVNGAPEQTFPAALANEACVNFNTIK